MNVNCKEMTMTLAELKSFVESIPEGFIVSITLSDTESGSDA